MTIAARFDSWATAREKGSNRGRGRVLHPSMTMAESFHSLFLELGWHQFPCERFGSLRDTAGAHQQLSYRRNLSIRVLPMPRFEEIDVAIFNARLTHHEINRGFAPRLRGWNAKNESGLANRR